MKQAKLIDHTLSQYTERLAHPELGPGAGSASALTGLLGVSSIEMAMGHLKMLQPFPSEELDPSCLFKQYHQALAILIDADAEAFLKVITARRLVEGTLEQQTEKEKAIQDALIGAIEIPLAIAQTSLEALEVTAHYGPFIEAPWLSEALFGAETLGAAVEGGILNVAANLAEVTDSALVNEYKQKCYFIRQQAQAHLDTIRHSLLETSSFRWLKES